MMSGEQITIAEHVTMQILQRDIDTLTLPIALIRLANSFWQASPQMSLIDVFTNGRQKAIEALQKAATLLSEQSHANLLKSYFIIADLNIPPLSKAVMDAYYAKGVQPFVSPRDIGAAFDRPVLTISVVQNAARLREAAYKGSSDLQHESQWFVSTVEEGIQLADELLEASYCR